MREKCPSILAGQQNGRGRSIAGITSRFRNDPNHFTERRAVGREDSGTVDQGLIVRLPVFLAQIAPIASVVPLEEFSGWLTGLLKEFEGTGRGDDSADHKFRLGFGDHRHLPVLLWLKNAGWRGVC